MATRGLVGALDPESGEIYAIFCHYDSYPKVLGQTLLEHYSSNEKVVGLIEMGGASEIGPTILESKFYHRDKGEPVNREHYASRQEYLGSFKDSDIEYIYLWEDGQWSYARHDFKKFKKLTARSS